MERNICFTIDVEPDFGGLLAKDEYFGIANLRQLSDMVSQYDLNITAFVTGKTLYDMPQTLDLLLSMKAEIEQHCYGHQVGSQTKLKDIERGIESYEKLFGKTPNGYHAPQGIISSEEIFFLKEKFVKFDS
jgi:peptidoglycan/xylan/chitin deacetylase (PgdA/CDA1 family)